MRGIFRDLRAVHIPLHLIPEKYMIATRFAPVIFFCTLVAGCAHDSPVVSEELAQQRLDFLQDGSTTQEEALFRLGLPLRGFRMKKF